MPDPQNVDFEVKFSMTIESSELTVIQARYSILFSKMLKIEKLLY
jgi:hypothetical protein